jgi:hypothetical protein
MLCGIASCSCREVGDSTFDPRDIVLTPSRSYSDSTVYSALQYVFRLLFDVHISKFISSCNL